MKVILRLDRDGLFVFLDIVVDVVLGFVDVTHEMQQRWTCCLNDAARANKSYSVTERE